MRFLTIRAKITIWYTFFMIILLMVMMELILNLSNEKILINQRGELINVIEEVEEDVMDGDSIDYFDNGVYVIKYNANKIYVEGVIPNDFTYDLPLQDGVLQKVEKGERIFYVYDKQMIDQKGELVWFRGVISEIRSNQINAVIVGTAFILLPVLVLLSSMMGYFLTKRALRPVRKIQETAKKITESKELSMRIGLPKGKDEISNLGETIDSMLEQLEQSFEKEKQFTSDASHELRTPLSVILNESEYGIKHLETVEEARESMEVINRQANKMTNLINQLLFLARADEDNIQLEYEYVDIKALIEEVIKEGVHITSGSNIKINLVDERKHSRRYLVDRMLFFRGVQNIIQNAINYGKQNGNVLIRLFEVEEYLVVEVEDDGIGIDEDKLDKIWNRFYQVDKARSRTKSDSMGLGLSMVKWITEQHGGYVKVESKIGIGSKFSLYFLIDRKDV